ncbi:methylenetetrahydrofolate reductase [Candidatus Tachikawaea gelatinosa]|uniref:Methylenetetrahydrofolate reductase n=1 Tax=Candidatus Tachikawaea gelatinosa TaxID=1410383 RepID=A0A090AQG2_9ENTR|nr:methylenetetrahydrofolate reductase [Candidatus Tachikawaea gelatinosa]BAP58587.1 methylenetetrahydrofolate reductase [Candidatus Tachikawaea gelatinosa]
MNSFALHKNKVKSFNKYLLEINKSINISFEFFPPVNQKMEDMFWISINKLNTLSPNFISITYNNKIGKNNRTHSIVKKLKNHKKINNIAPHLTCINFNREELLNIAHNYWNQGIRHIVALRGDQNEHSINSKMYACDLVSLLKEVGNFEISVAAYPESHINSKNAYQDLIYLKRKIDCGANRAITQFFFDTDIYLRFRDECAAIGINVDIVPGILPILNFQQLCKFANFTKVHIPKWIYSSFEKLEKEPKIEKIISANIAIEMIKILSKEGVKNFHFYTLNRSEITYAICRIINFQSY